jgi:hypothetical protein
LVDRISRMRTLLDEHLSGSVNLTVLADRAMA